MKRLICDSRWDRDDLRQSLRTIHMYGVVVVIFFHKKLQSYQNYFKDIFLLPFFVNIER